MPELQSPVVGDIRTRQVARWEAGDRVLIEALLPAHAELAADTLLDLIYAEVLLREEFGDTPTLEEYICRFPACAEGLRRQFAFHAALGVLDTGIDATLPQAGNAPTFTEIGSYEILGEIGRGGMGVVFKGRHRTLPTRVAAIKVLRCDGPDERARFLGEARAVAALQHPNIVRVHDVSDSLAAIPFVALEYIDGGTLAARIGGTPLLPREAAAVLLPLAEAVAHAHAAEIIHRDLKPGNVMLASDGTPRLTDFGLAKRLDIDSSRTRTGAVMGTPSYMAPEQARGEKGVGPTADVYGLGAVLYEMLTGRPPFLAATAIDTIMQVIDADPVPPRALNPSVPRDLEAACLKCLEKSPSGRYATAGELADDMRRFLAGEPMQVRPAGPIERSAKWVRRNPGATLTLAASLAVLTAFAVLWAMFTLQLDEKKREAIRDRDDAIAQKKIADEQKEAARIQKELAEKQGDRARALLALTAATVDEIAISVRASKIEETKAGNPGTVVFKLACHYARVSKSLAADDGLNAGDRARLSEQYAVSAIRLLVCAEKLGYFTPDRPANREALRTTPDLGVLRGRAEYKDLVARLN